MRVFDAPLAQPSTFTYILQKSERMPARLYNVQPALIIIDTGGTHWRFSNAIPADMSEMSPINSWEKRLNVLIVDMG